MAQIDSYLNRVFAECKMSYQEDFYELYTFAQNDDLRKLFAIYHTQLNKWFITINNNIRTGYDDEGHLAYQGGYFHAQDSRNLLELMDSIDQLRTKCSATEYAFRLSNDIYDDAIRRCRRFVVKSGGSTIPEDFLPIEIEELSPIFQMSKSIAVEQDKKTLYANLSSIGEGSYSRVFSYIDPFYDFPIVLKRALAELDNKEIVRFKQEFEVLKALYSPYIVEVYSYDDSNNSYTMEYMDENIYEYIRHTNSFIPFAKRKNIIMQVCRGLIYIHGKGCLHRDISLTNVFIKHYDDVDVVKIGDFGLVKIPESNLTSFQSELKGSLNDPDLIHVGFGNYEMCHEIFALTRLCYFVLTGRTNIEKQKNESIKQFWTKGTNTDRAKRFQSVKELQQYVMNLTEN